MDLPHVASCELEWRRQRTFFFHNENKKETDDKDIVPVVELKPFSRKVWRKSRSLPVVDSIAPFTETKSRSESPRSPVNDRYSDDPRQIYRDTIYLLTELENQKLSSIYANHYQNSVSGDSKKLPRVPNSRGFPIRPVGFASVRDRESVTSEVIKLGKQTQSLDPAMYIRGEAFSDFSSPAEHRRTPRSRSVPNSFYRTGGDYRGQPWPVHKGPILVNNTPLSSEKRAWSVADSCQTPLIPEFSEMEFGEIQTEYSKLLRRIKMERFLSQQDSIITKTLGAPTKGEVSIRLGMYQNLSREKIQELKKRNEMKQRARREEQQLSSENNKQVDGSQLRSNDEEIPDESFQDIPKSKTAKSVTFEDEQENPNEEEAESERSETSSRRLQVDVPNQEVPAETDQTQTEITVEENTEALLIQVQEADQEVAKITGVEDDEQPENSDEQRLGPKIFLTSTSRQGTPGGTPRDGVEDSSSNTEGLHDQQTLQTDGEIVDNNQEPQNMDDDDDDSSVSSGEEMLDLQQELCKDDSIINQDDLQNATTPDPIIPEPSETAVMD